MNNKLFVGNLSFKMTDADLAEVFSQHGEVVSVVIPQDRETGRQRGFAFVEMATQSEAEAAIKALNGANVGGRDLAVSISQPKAPRTNGRPRW